MHALSSHVHTRPFSSARGRSANASPPHVVVLCMWIRATRLRTLTRECVPQRSRDCTRARVHRDESHNACAGVLRNSLITNHWHSAYASARKRETARDNTIMCVCTLPTNTMGASCANVHHMHIVCTCTSCVCVPQEAHARYAIIDGWMDADGWMVVASILRMHARMNLLCVVWRMHKGNPTFEHKMKRGGSLSSLCAT